ncbi:recombinase family protein [Hyphomonas atlantica corrig.]|uniref:recombinase family protein n=1 Tax=Hyphomonas atlantica TaxID=1280948 RepID=UPI002352A921|nr:recombinase family protein [Hyphomonas atlantica]
MRKIGYARVSTQDQTLEAQKEALLNAGADLLFTEKVSGANRNRPRLSALLDSLQQGDLVLVTRLDRFARSTLDMLTLTEAITAKGAAFRSLAEPWADTTTPHGKMIVTVLAGVAEFERSLIRQRTGEGRRRAQSQGVRFGRPPALAPAQQKEALRLAEAKGNRYAAEIMGVSIATVERIRAKARKVA